MSDRPPRWWWAALVAVALLVTGGYGVVVVKARGVPPKPDAGIYLSRLGSVTPLNSVRARAISRPRA